MGCASAHIDTDLAPFVCKSFYKHYKDGVKYIEKKDIDKDQNAHFHPSMSIEHPLYKEYSEAAYQYAMDMLEREGRQAAEGLFHNLGTLESRAGSQVKAA